MIYHEPLLSSASIQDNPEHGLNDSVEADELAFETPQVNLVGDMSESIAFARRFLLDGLCLYGADLSETDEYLDEF